MRDRFATFGVIGLVLLGLAALRGYTKSSLLDELGSEPTVQASDSIDDRLNALENKFETKLDRRTESLDQLYQTTAADVAQLKQWVNELYEYHHSIKSGLAEIDKSIESIETNQQSILKEVLGLMKQCEAPPKTASDPGRRQSELTFFYGDSCQPCNAWKVSPDREQIANEVHIVPVHVSSLAPAERPKSVPSFILRIGDNQARHSGFLSLQRFKDMQRAILERQSIPAKSVMYAP